jgi:hypothetical protein
MNINQKAKIFWLKSWQGLFLIMLFLSLPCYLVTKYFGLTSSLIPLMIGVSIAAVRKIIADIMIVQ